MADSKITALTALTAADPANDMIPIVDVSDTPPASGNTKRISINNILACSPTATLASATITGDLTLTGGTANGVPYLNASKVVTTSDKLSFAQTGGFFSTTFNINSLLGAANYKGGIVVTEDDNSFSLYGGTGYKLIDAFGYATPNQLRFYASNAEQYRIGASGVFTWYDGAGGTRMTLNSTGLGVGVTPSAGRGAIQLSAGVGFPATQVASSDVNTLDDYEEGTWTPTVTATAGTLTTTTVNAAAYTKIGRLVSVQVDISIVNIGTASGLLVFSLPTGLNQVTDANVGVLRELGATGQMGQIIYQSATQVAVALYNNGTMIVNGYRFRGTYTYTAAT